MNIQYSIMLYLIHMRPIDLYTDFYIVFAIGQISLGNIFLIRFFIRKNHSATMENIFYLYMNTKFIYIFNKPEILVFPTQDSI